jgi:signal transduction histidine kinase
MPTPPSDKVGLSPTPSASEIDAILLDLYRICCASLPERQQAVLSPAATIGSPMLECVQAVAQADQGALVLAHLSGSMGVWLAPGELERGAIDRVLALSHTSLDHLLARHESQRWLRYAVPLASEDNTDNDRGRGVRSRAASGATHLVLALGWAETPHGRALTARARVLIAGIAEALRSGVNMVLLQEWIDGLLTTGQTTATQLQEAELASAEWQQAFDAFVDPICIIDANYRVVRANAAHRALYGHEATPSERHHCYVALERRSGPCESCPLPQTLLTGRPGFVRRDHTAALDAEGHVERRVYEVWSYPVRNPAGEVVHAVEIVKDVTEHERLHEMATSMESLRSADRLKAELLGTVSHELRSPLAAIKGYAATLLRHERRLAREERHEFLRAIVEGSDRLELLIGQLLEMSELSTGAFVLRHESLDVAPIIRDAIEHCERTLPSPVAAAHVFALAITDPAGHAVRSAPRVAADPRLLRDVVDNLLENAVKYMPAGGIISVRVSVRPGERVTTSAGQRPPGELAEPVPALDTPALEIAVHDNGVGIPADHLGRIFDQFHRVDTRLTREVDGLGLGLAICKRIVELHGGAIWAESEPGAGSTFHVLLPLEDPGAMPGQPVLSAETEEH